MDAPLKKYPLWKQAVDDFIAEQRPFGSHLTRQWLIDHLEISVPSRGSMDEFRKFETGFLAARVRFFDTLRRDHGIQFRDAKDGEWELLHPREATRYAIEKGAREMKDAWHRSHDRVTHVPLEQLTDQERAENADVQARLGEKRAMLMSLKAPPRALPNATSSGEEPGE